jgi:hypothetical protein
MKLRIGCVVVGFLSLVLSLVQPTFAQAPAETASALPRLVRLGGTVKDLNGTPLAGLVGITFTLYSEQTGGAGLWLETQNVTADSNGHYTALLGSTKPDGLPAELFTSEQARWVGVQVSGQPEQPRVLLVAVPYALKAGDAETIAGLPASAFVLANQETRSGAKGASAPASARVQKNSVPAANPGVTGIGVVGYIPMWDTTSDIVDSVIFQKSSAIGIATTAPAATLDVNGKTDVRDTLTLFPMGTDSTLAINGTAFKVDQTGKLTFVSTQTFSGASLALPSTSSASVGVITLGGNRFLHNFGTNNTFLGAGAGNMAMTGTGANTAVGVSALTANTTGTNNSALGYLALGANTTGHGNSAFGYLALSANTTGIQNEAFGSGTLSLNTTGIQNAGFGLAALGSNTTGASNSAFGYAALNANTTGIQNEAFGIDALLANKTGNGNAAFGGGALAKNTTGGSSTTTGGNSAFGNFALFTNTTAGGNSAFGFSALTANTTGNNNVAVGAAALAKLTSGGGNIAVGTGAGGNLGAAESNNIYVGNSGIAGESNTIRIGFIGTQTAAFVAGISGKASPNGVAVLVNGTGQLGTTTSSRRFKHQIADIGAESDVLMKLRPVAFYYKPELDETQTRQFGLVAEEVAQVAPQLVLFGEDGTPQTVRYHFVNAMLLNEVQKQRQLVEEQQKTNEEQNNTIARQQEEIQDLAARVVKLETLLAAKR